MSSDLFRKEAIENNTQRLLGSVLLLSPISFWVATLLLTLIVGVIATLLVFGSFARREAVSGYLVPDKGIVWVYPQYNGIINQYYISDGQQINKGDNLVEINTERGTKDSLSVHQQLLNRLLAQKLNLEQRIIDETSVFESENNRLSLTLGNTNSEYQQLLLQQQNQKEQVLLAKSTWEKYQALRKKELVSEDELTLKRNVYFNAKATLNNTKRLLLNKRTEITNTQKQSEQLPLRKSNRLQELQLQHSQLEERIVELKSSHSYMIKAPVNGRVTASQVTIGQQVTSTAPVLTIIPENTILHAELFLPSRAIGFVKKGQQVLIRYDAFPYQRYGLYQGTITQIAEAVINPAQIPIPIPVKEPVYRIKVALQKQNINAYGKKMPLQSGMSVAADIILEERSLGQWLLEPIYSLKGRL